MLELQRVSKTYGAIRALTDVSATVEQGSILALVGENGAGKSTLVKCIAGAEVPDSGTITVDGHSIGKTPKSAIQRGVSVVWQDLALCENLDVTANLFLGREVSGGLGLRRSTMHSATRRVFEELDVAVPDLGRSIERLSGGQRQLVAIARATLDLPRILVLDEPTAALGVTESRTIRRVIRALQREGVGIVLVSHQLDEVFELADQILVLRHGKSVGLVNRSEAHPDDIVTMITGGDADTSANQQLNRLHSLSEQLADADASTVLPITVTSLSDAMSCDRLAVFLTYEQADGVQLRLTAALNLSPTLEHALRNCPIDSPDDFVMQAAETERIVLLPDLGAAAPGVVADLAVNDGLLGAWATPIVGQHGTIAVIVGFTDRHAGLQKEQKQLLELFSSMAGAAIDRGHLVESLRVNVQSLEGLQGVLEVFAAEEDPSESFDAALKALREATDAAAIELRINDDGVERVESVGDAVGSADHANAVPHAEAPFAWSKGVGSLRAWWVSDDTESFETAPLLHGAANSFRLALERGLVREARQEAASLRVSRSLERNLTRRLGHELRTPLTAIQGFASTLMQSDVEWADADRRRFTQLIEVESERLSRLVDALFDTASLEAGTFLPNLDYCNVAVAARRAGELCDSGFLEIDLPESLVVWGDGDKLEQIFINLINNAQRHNPPGTKATVTHTVSDNGRVGVTVRDNGGGLPSDVTAYFNGHRAALGPDRGLGVRLVRGFMIAMGGHIHAESSADGTLVRLDFATEPEAS